MQEIKTNDLIKREPYPSIIRMLHAFLEEGLELKHFRYELIGKDNLDPDVAKKVNNYLEKRRAKYIHKIDKDKKFLKKKKEPVGTIEKALNRLRTPQHRVVYKEKRRYYLTDKDRYIALVAEEDKKNIDYNVKIKKLNAIEDVGINLYGFPAKIPAFIRPGHKKYLEKTFTDAVNHIALGTNFLQMNILLISLQIKANTWKDVTDTIENKKILLLDRQILLLSFIVSLFSSMEAVVYFKRWFGSDNLDNFWFWDRDWLTNCFISEDGRIHHPPKTLLIENPDQFIIDFIKSIDSAKKEGDIYLELKNHEINKKVSSLILSLSMLLRVPESIGTLCVVSNPPSHRFFDSTEIAAFSSFVGLSTDSILAQVDDRRKEFMPRSNEIETSEDFFKSFSEMFVSDEIMKDPLVPYKKKRLDYHKKQAEYERMILGNILKEEGKNSKALLLLSKPTETMEIIKLLAPKE